MSPSSHARRSNASSKSWISDTTYEVPSMFEENADISTNNSHPITQTQPEDGMTWKPGPCKSLLLKKSYNQHMYLNMHKFSQYYKLHSNL